MESVQRRARSGRRSILAALAWAVAYFVASFYLTATERGGSLRLVIALLPLPFFALYLWWAVRNAREMDELQRRIQLEALAIGLPTAVFLAMALGLVQKAGYLLNQAFADNWVIIVVPYFIGYAIARRRYL